MCKRIFKEQTKSIGDVPFYKIGTFGKEPDAYIEQELYDEFKSKYPYPQKGNILISTSGTIGKTVIFNGASAYFQDSNIVWIENNEKLVLDKYLYNIFEEIEWGAVKGGTIERLYNNIIEEVIVKIPSVEIQNKIVADIEKERELIEGNKKLIELYESKIKQVINKIWE